MQFLAFLSNDQPIFVIQTEILAIYLHIDTTQSKAIIGISNNGNIIDVAYNENAHTHAEFVPGFPMNAY